MTNLTAAVERLMALCELRKQATEGEWFAYRSIEGGGPTVQVLRGWLFNAPEGLKGTMYDAALCAAAANATTDDLPAFLADWKRQGEEIERLRLDLSASSAQMVLDAGEIERLRGLVGEIFEQLCHGPCCRSLDCKDLESGERYWWCMMADVKASPDICPYLNRPDVREITTPKG
ncbi:MAG: hypothetical protein ACYDCO_01835 [Armatimonadota bacterium]